MIIIGNYIGYSGSGNSGEVLPDQLQNKVLWLREDNINSTNEIDNWVNKYNGSLDAVKITDLRRPFFNATGINGVSSLEFTRANNDTLQTEAGLGLTGDFTVDIIFKVTDPTIASPQFLIENIDNGASFVNTGFQITVVNSLIRVDFRDGTNTQRAEFAFTSTAWQLLTIKHDSNGAGASRNTIKLNGVLKYETSVANAVTHNSNLLKIGGNFQSANAFGGSIAEIIITSDYQSNTTERGLKNYFNNRYGLSVVHNNEYNFSGLTSVDAISEAWNGLAPLQREDGKYDLIGGTLTGKIYYFEQGATVDDWTATQIIDSGDEIQSLKIYGRDAGKLVLITVHKDLSGALNGNVRIHKAQTIDDKGAYSSVTLVTNRNYPQDILVYDVDGDGADEFLFTYQGTSGGSGGINWFDWNGSDIINASNWTEHVAKQHESAWWMAGFHNIAGIDRLVFSARNNRNPASVPGIFYLTPAAIITDAWTETTIDNTVADWMHVDVGNFSGNSNDIVAINNGTDDVSFYNAANSWEKTTINGSSLQGSFNVRKIAETYNSRNILLHIVENDRGYIMYWNGTTWIKEPVFATITHPADNEVLYLDLDGSGEKYVVFDDSSTLVSSHIFKFSV